MKDTEEVADLSQDAKRAGATRGIGFGGKSIAGGADWPMWLHYHAAFITGTQPITALKKRAGCRPPGNITGPPH